MTRVEEAVGDRCRRKRRKNRGGVIRENLTELAVVV